MTSYHLYPSEVREVFDLFDFWDGRDGLIDAVKVGDLLRCVELNPTEENVKQWGGTKAMGEYWSLTTLTLTLTLTLNLTPLRPTSSNGAAPRQWVSTHHYHNPNPKHNLHWGPRQVLGRHQEL